VKTGIKYISKRCEQREITEIIKDLRNREVDVYLNINNHYEGCTPLTIAKLKNLL
jgi:excinuclease UvrABC helicase subunit UvrB